MKPIEFDLLIDKFVKDLDTWLQTEEHDFHCNSYNEGLYCCLDNIPDEEIGAKGRQWIINWLKTNLGKD